MGEHVGDGFANKETDQNRLDLFLSIAERVRTWEKRKPDVTEARVDVTDGEVRYISRLGKEIPAEILAGLLGQK